MKVYELVQRSHPDDDMLKIIDGSRRIYKYFVLNEGDGGFLKFSTPKAQAQEYFDWEKFRSLDFLEANIPVPIFSDRARVVLEKNFSSEIQFFPLEISTMECGARLNLCKITTYRTIVDQNKSTFSNLTDGSKILAHAKYYSDFDKPFNIARDISTPSQVVVSERFVNLCQSENLSIDFLALPQ